MGCPHRAHDAPVYTNQGHLAPKQTQGREKAEVAAEKVKEGFGKFMTGFNKWADKTADKMAKVGWKYGINEHLLVVLLGAALFLGSSPPWCTERIVPGTVARLDLLSSSCDHVLLHCCLALALSYGLTDIHV